MIDEVVFLYLDFIRNGVKIKYENNKWYWLLKHSKFNNDKEWHETFAEYILKYGVK